MSSNPTIQPGEEGPAARFAVFRASDAPAMIPAKERGVVRKEHVEHPATAEGVRRFGQEAAAGATARILFSSAEMHVSYAWFKSGFPLPLHSHDRDCFYQVIAGSMRVGTEELLQGDGMLVPAGVPYTVTPGDDGVEFLEVRPNGEYDTRYRGNTHTYWDKIVATIGANRNAWASELPPFDLLGLNP